MKARLRRQRCIDFGEQCGVTDPVLGYAWVMADHPAPAGVNHAIQGLPQLFRSELYQVLIGQSEHPRVGSAAVDRFDKMVASRDSADCVLGFEQHPQGMDVLVRSGQKAKSLRHRHIGDAASQTYNRHWRRSSLAQRFCNSVWQHPRRGGRGQRHDHRRTLRAP